jgi:hypothetical protein
MRKLAIRRFQVLPAHDIRLRLIDPAQQHVEAAADAGEPFTTDCSAAPLATTCCDEPICQSRNRPHAGDGACG